MAAVRQVINPLEGDDVVGITNYFDVGMQLRVSSVGEREAWVARVACGWEWGAILRGRAS